MHATSVNAVPMIQAAHPGSPVSCVHSTTMPIASAAPVVRATGMADASATQPAVTQKPIHTRFDELP